MTKIHMMESEPHMKWPGRRHWKSLYWNMVIDILAVLRVESHGASTGSRFESNRKHVGLVNTIIYKNCNF
jgi:hypothetical protein